MTIIRKLTDDERLLAKKAEIRRKQQIRKLLQENPRPQASFSSTHSIQQVHELYSAREARREARKRAQESTQQASNNTLPARDSQSRTTGDTH